MSTYFSNVYKDRTRIHHKRSRLLSIQQLGHDVQHKSSEFIRSESLLLKNTFDSMDLDSDRM